MLLERVPRRGTRRFDPSTMPMPAEKHREATLDDAAIQRRLEDTDIRVNPERLQILGRLMSQTGQACTAQELYPRGVEESNAAAVSRVYRTLHLLEKKRVIERRVRQVRGRPVFTYIYGEESASSRIRFQCRSCGASVVADDIQLREQVAKVGADQGLPVASKEDIVVWIACNRCSAGTPD